MKRIQTLRNKSTDQLKQRLEQISISTHRWSAWLKKGWTVTPESVKSASNVKALHSLRKERARILTILAERRQQK